MDKMDLKKYGITGVTEIVYNPSYDELFREETKKGLRGFEKGQETEMGAVNVMTGDRKSTRLNSSHNRESRMPSSA